MSLPFLPCLVRLAVWTLAGTCTLARADNHAEPHGHQHEAPPGRLYPGPVDMLTADAAKAHETLPPLPDDVSELRFRDLFKLPVGDRGLQFSDKARALAGRRVRILGHMVREDMPASGRLLLAPFPFTLLTAEYGACEDLPATVVHVHASASSVEAIPFTPGLLLLTGVLELGNQEESDGRISAVRLRLDPPRSPNDLSAAGAMP